MTQEKKLGERVTQFHMLELPGQPQGMHMGTSYLVNDLWRALQETERDSSERLKALLAAQERVRELEEMVKGYGR